MYWEIVGMHWEIVGIYWENLEIVGTYWSNSHNCGYVLAKLWVLAGEN